MPVTITENVFSVIVSYAELQKQNKQLKKEHLMDSISLLKNEALEHENIRLRRLLKTSFKLDNKALIAELLTVNLVSYEHVISINKGSMFGIHIKHPVLDAHGIFGQVIRTLPLSSEVMLITDPNHAIPVQINRTGLRTIAVGTGKLDQLHLPFLTNNTDIIPGDLLISSGLGGTFPYGYPVAVVNNVTVQPNKSFASIYATPKANLNSSRELLIIYDEIL